MEYIICNVYTNLLLNSVYRYRWIYHSIAGKHSDVLTFIIPNKITQNRDKLWLQVIDSNLNCHICIMYAWFQCDIVQCDQAHSKKIKYLATIYDELLDYTY